ncbi:MAG: hypothetical protein ACTSRA_00880 [Promethearchaeota archaeon]|nr:MAG: hypothetical protein [Helarchaeota virus Nidhogg Meg22_1012]URC17332.1 MAG: hypothetical protein [Helarchaeota virus Nidhogg Meg22_1214]
MDLYIDHPVYDNFLNLWDLYGKSYDVIKISTFFVLTCHARRFYPLYFGKELIDGRLHAFYIMRAGTGKTSIYDMMNTTITHIPNEVFSTSDRLHVDHLIGKKVVSREDNPDYVIGKSKKKFIDVMKDNKGILSKDFVAFDEAQVILKDERKEEIRSTLKKAMNTIGNNEVIKHRVDVSFDDPIRYRPTCTIVFFMQPMPIDFSTLSTGLMRRGILLYIKPSMDEVWNGLGEKVINVVNETRLNSSWKKWIKFLCDLKGSSSLETYVRRNNVVEFTDGTMEEMFSMTNKINKRLIGKIIGPANDLLNSMQSDIMRNMLRVSSIISIMERHEQVEVDDITRAGKYLYWMVNSSLKFVEEWATASVSRNLEENMIQSLKYLYDTNATSYKESVLYDELVTFIKNNTGLAKETIRKQEINKMKKLGLIETKGTKRARVWITEKGLNKVMRNDGRA